MYENRITLFDSIKGIAILMIMVIHLGQLCLPLAEGERLTIIISSGPLGVELTFLVNAFFFTRHFKSTSVCAEVASGDGYCRYILHSIIRIIPVYWFGLIVYGISCYYVKGALDVSIISVLSHFFFFNGISPIWWNEYMGGSGYFGVLVILWFLFSLYINHINNRKQAFLYMLIVIPISTIIRHIVVFYFPDEAIFTWINYIYRGICCFSLGCTLFFCCGDKKKEYLGKC